MRINFCLFLLVLLLNSMTAFCQQNQIDALDAFSGSLIKRLREDQGEKAHLVTNKTIYTTGEAVWFRTFLVGAVSEKVSTRSKHLFVDIVNENDSVLTRSVLHARQQQTSGKLLLPDTLSTGPYWIRAYTKAMIADEPEHAAVIPLYVINPVNPSPARSMQKIPGHTASEQSLVLEMFPEGGTLVTGINTTIGFYLHDKAGNPLSLTGSIKDNRDTIVAAFTTNSLGLAKAEFSPFIHRKYRAVFSYKDKEFSQPLPPFNPFAGQLAVHRIADNTLKIRTVLEDSIYRKDAVTYLIGLARDSLCFTSIGYGSNETDVPLANYPKGIVTFLLFDQNFRLLSERKVAIKEHHLNVTAVLDKAGYSKRAQAKLSTTVLTKNNKPVPASLTIAVSDSSAVIDNDAIIMQHLLKKTKDAGIANWDLARLTNLPEQDIDLLLLNSPSFYNNTIAKSRKRAESADDSLFYIRGRLHNAKGEPLPNQTLNLISKADNGLFVSDTTDAAGNFLFPLLGYMDSTQFMIQVSTAKSRSETPDILLENFLFPRFATPAFLKQTFTIPAAQRMAYARHYADTTLTGNRWLQPVRLDAKGRNDREDPRRLSSGGYVLTSEQLMKLGMGNIGTGILRMPGVQLINGFLRFYGPDQFSGANANSEPMVLLDGVQLTLSGGAGGTSSSPVIQYLNSLNPREIDFIEVLKGPEASMYGVRGGEGVIAIHTSSQIHQDFGSKEGNVFRFFRQGYARPAAFPVVSYEQKVSKELTSTDSRSVLYWNENELTDNAGKALFTFFTNDIPGRYKVIVTGITVSGDFIYQTLGFTIR